jgi:signal transduction histidine kinase
MTNEPRLLDSCEAMCGDYSQALERYVTDGGEIALSRGYDLGRKALSKGISLLELSAMHQRALLTLIPRHAGEEVEVVKAATQFLAETLAPFEMANLGFFEANEALRALNDTLESEAKRIARTLHDGAGQLLFALELALGEILREVRPSVGPRVAELLELTHELDQQLRCLSRELHPVILDDLGLIPALEILAKRLSSQTGLAVCLKTSITDRLSSSIESCLYRAIQEALTNVVRHARAGEVTIELTLADGNLVCTVSDNGVGFPKGRARLSRGGGLGLVGIRERLTAVGGSIRFNTGLKQGTELIFTIPLNSSVRPEAASVN